VWTVAFAVARSRGTLPELARELERAPGPVEWDMLGRVRDAQGDLEGALVATRAALTAAPATSRSAAASSRCSTSSERAGRHGYAGGAGAPAADDSQLAVELIERQTRRGHRDEAAAAFESRHHHFGHNRARCSSSPRWRPASVRIGARLRPGSGSTSSIPRTRSSSSAR
jgi:hypothetical protein